jgi:hypothetical protein
MKDKEKQIEEMAKGLLEYIKVYGKLHLTVDGIDNTARLLAKFGITKIPEDSVVLSREEFENNLTLYMGYKIGSKETAEKIWLQAKAIVDKTKHLVQGREYLHIDALKEIVKSCGVEVKEN